MFYLLTYLLVSGESAAASNDGITSERDDINSCTVYLQSFFMSTTSERISSMAITEHSETDRQTDRRSATDYTIHEDGAEQQTEQWRKPVDVSLDM